MVKAGFLARRPGQGHPRHRGRADPGHPALPRPRRHRQDAAPADRSPSWSSSPSCSASPSRTPTCNAVAHGGGWQTFMAGLAFTIALSGLGLDRVRQRLHPLLPAERLEEGHRRLGLPRHGRARDPHHDAGRGGRDLRRSDIGTGSGGLLPFAHQSAIPAWFVVVFLLFAVVQLFGINSLDMYSSGVTLQAIGVPGEALPGRARRLRHRLRRHHVRHLQLLVHHVPRGLRRRGDRLDRAVVSPSSWSTGSLRRYRYVPSELQKTGPTSLYWNSGGVFWPAIIAQVVGMFAAISALSADVPPPALAERGHLPQPVRRRLQHLPGHGRRRRWSTTCWPTRKVRKEADAQEELLDEEGLLPA